MTKHSSWIVTAVVAIAMVALVPAGTASAAILQASPTILQAAPQAETMVVTHGESYATRKAAMQSLHDQLVGRQVAGAEARGLTVKISAADAERINAPIPASGRLLVGAVLTVNTPIDLGGTARLQERTAGREFGALRSRRDGGFVWSGLVTAPGASAVRLHFTGFDLPEGAVALRLRRQRPGGGPVHRPRAGGRR